MEIAALQRLQTLFIKQKITFMVNRYEVWSADAAGNPSGLIAFAQQKRMAMREQVTLYRDESRSEVLAAFKARSVLDLRGTYDVTDGAGAPIGTFRKDFAQSLLRSTWHVDQPGLPTATGQERNLFVALLRRFSDISFLPYHFDFVSGGTPVFSVDKRWGITDKYVVRISSPQLDRRLVIAMAVALDALQSR